MFKILKTGITALALTFVICCGKEKSVDTPGTTGNPNGNSGKLSMTIDGKPWVADKDAAASILQGRTGIFGTSFDRKTLILSIGATVPGEYQLDQNSIHMAAWTDSTDTSPEVYTTNQGAGQADAGGKVIISKIDAAKKTISGSFQFNLFRDLDNNRKTVLDGLFQDLPYGETSDPVGDDSPTGTSSMKATIDGTGYEAQTTAAVLYQDRIAITGTSGDGVSAIAIQMPAAVNPGTYDFDLFAGYVGFYIAGAAQSYSSESGKLVITEHNKATKFIKGTFSFKAANLLGGAAKQVTNGSFSATYN
jgi:hypothetical protein